MCALTLTHAFLCTVVYYAVVSYYITLFCVALYHKLVSAFYIKKYSVALQE